MDNPAYICTEFQYIKSMDSEEKLLLKRLTEAYNTKNIEKFKLLIQRPDPKCRYSFVHQTPPNTMAATNFFLRLNLLRNFSFPQIEITSNSIIKEQNLSQKILFNRSEHELSLFEKILSEPESKEFISLIWSECELWRDEGVLMIINPMGKLLIDYVIQSGDDDNLFTFLIYDLKDKCDNSINNSDNNYFLKLKNDQFTRMSGMSLFNKLYGITQNNDKLKECKIIMEELLKEMKEINDIRREVRVDNVLEMDDEKVQDELLKILIKYWKVNSKDYHYYRNTFAEISLFHKVFLALKESNENEFEDIFPEYFDFLKSKHPDDFNKQLQEDCNLLLTFALNHGLKKAMKILITCYTVDLDKLCSSTSIHYDLSFNNEYAIKKLLEKGYYMGYEDDERVSKDGNWINAKVFQQFLDSCVTISGACANFSCPNREQTTRGIQINYTFLIAPEIRSITMKNDQDDNRQLLFSAGMRPLEVILNNEKLRHLITHPVLSTFINLKSYKFSQFYNINLHMFIFFYVLPFLVVFTNYEPNESEIQILIPASVATFYLTIREAIQFFWIIDSKLEYFKKKSNKLEMMMIFTSWWLLIAVITQNYHGYQVASAFIILFAAVELLCILPYSSLSIYMFMLKEVSITFLKFFTIFILIILAFTFSFCAILKPIKHLHHNRNYGFNESVSNITNESVFKNFEHPFTSFIKTILMFAGDFSVDPYNGIKRGDLTCKDVEKDQDSKDDSQNCLNRTIKKILTFMVNRYPYLHKMDNLWIDLKHKTVLYKVNQRQVPVLKAINGKGHSYSLDDESYERLITIIKQKDINDGDLNDKVCAMHKNIMQLIAQQENLQKLIGEVLQKHNL
ncbi:unnamed protein product [Diamesa hyperborea]